MDCPLASQILGDEVGRAASPPIQASGGYSMHSEAGLGRKLPVAHRLLILSSDDERASSKVQACWQDLVPGRSYYIMS